MGFTYFIFDNDGTRHELDPQKPSFLDLLLSTKEGEIYIDRRNQERQSDENTIKFIIKYNVNSAEVDVLDANSPPGVTAFFYDQTSIEIRRPIYNSITVLAEIDLLNQLYALNDEKICAIIAKNHFDPNSNNQQLCVRNTTLKSIDDTLASIVQIKYIDEKRSIFQANPMSEKGRIIQEVLKEAQQKYLKTSESDRVLSLKQVADLIKEINQKIDKTMPQEPIAIPGP